MKLKVTRTSDGAECQIEFEDLGDGIPGYQDSDIKRPFRAYTSWIMTPDGTEHYIQVSKRVADASGNAAKFRLDEGCRRLNEMGYSLHPDIDL